MHSEVAPAAFLHANMHAAPGATHADLEQARAELMVVLRGVEFAVHAELGKVQEHVRLELAKSVAGLTLGQDRALGNLRGELGQLCTDLRADLEQRIADLHSFMLEESAENRGTWCSLSEHLEDLEHAVDEVRCGQRRDRTNASSSSAVQAQAMQRRLDHLDAFVNGMVEVNNLHSPACVLREHSPLPSQLRPQHGRVDRVLRRQDPGASAASKRYPGEGGQATGATAASRRGKRERKRGGRGQGTHDGPLDHPAPPGTASSSAWWDNPDLVAAVKEDPFAEMPW